MFFDPDLLRAFVAVVETGGFTKAGERMNLSQSAISHQIRKLEEQAGSALLRRTTRSVTLTEDGEEFLRLAEQILAAQSLLVHRFQKVAVSGAVRLGVPETYAGDRLTALLTRFSRRFPSVRLDVFVEPYGALNEQIHAGTLDLAVNLFLREDVEWPVLRRTRFVWAAGSGFEHEPEKALPLALAPSPCTHRDVCLDALVGAGREWRVTFTSASQQGLRSAAKSGLAVTVALQDDIQDGLVIAGDGLGLPTLPAASFRLMRSATARTPAVEALEEQLLGAAG
ncbi:LysR family transcriptional regulator [Stenotrophomonas maltophilia]|uniref:LysR family transcriptional regulator n=1 Tax=Stenotrophomonas maltophilia TaxID=40324 RepID=A0A2W6I6B1_STEMA|nr:LysR family transcriptional regulator [Stenotrophomonas maltophilia]PZS90843.1 LysR family transcriptional regulator [Stenotrophomonas maltophilia]